MQSYKQNNQASGRKDRDSVSKKCTFVQASVTPYFIMKTLTHCKRTTKVEFQKCSYPCIKLQNGYLLKFNDAAGVRQLYKTQFYNLMDNRVDKLQLQSFFGNLVGLGQATSRMVSLMWQFVSTLTNLVSTGQHIVGKLLLKRVNRWVLDVGLMLADLLSKPQLSGTQLAICVVRIYRLFEDTPTDLLTAQSWESILAVIGSLSLPKDCMELIRRLTSMSSLRVLEDITIIHQIGVSLMETIATGLKKIPGCSSMVDSFNHIWSVVAKHHFLLYRANVLVRQWRQNKTVMIDPAYRKEIQDLWKDFDTNEALTDWTRASAAVGKRYADFRALHQLSLSYENATRQEPVCIVLEGPPGCFKSRYMGMLLQVLEKSIYTHQIKTVGDGKDFYDQYDGQSIFVMDDLGQGGPSQYRTLMNLVSPIKYPLDCANEKLKDTKYFCSESIIFTTNAFSSLPSLTKQDGIVDPRALWRRAVVFDFTNVRRKVDSDNNSAMSGFIFVRSFDNEAGSFIEGYPGMTSASRVPMGNDKVVLAWMARHYINLVKLKQQMHDDNKLTQEDLAEVRALLHSQGSFSPRGRAGICLSQTDLDIYPMLCEIEPQTDHLMDVAEAFLGMATSEMQRSVDEQPRPSSFFTSIYNKVVGKIGAENTEVLATAVLTVLIYVMAFGLIELVIYLFSRTNKDKLEAQVEAEIKAHVSSSTSMNEALCKQIFFCNFVNAKGENKRSACLVSGHYLISPWHAASDAVYISLESKVAGCRLMDHAPVSKVYERRDNDVVVLKVDSSVMVPFKTLHHLLSISSPCHKGTALLTPYGVIPLAGEYKDCTPQAVVTLMGKQFTLNNENSVAYPLTMAGLCGSLLVSNSSGVLGAHVAGNAKYGRALRWDAVVVEELKVLLANDRLLLPAEVKPSQVPSGVKLDLNFHQSTPKTTDLLGTPLCGIFGPNLKEPVNLSKYGPHTVKDVFKKSTNVLNAVPQEDLEFARSYLDTIIAPFLECSEEQVVRGFKNVAPVNMDASTGIGCIRDRTVYFEGDRYSSLLREEIAKLTQDALFNNEVNPGLWVAKETLKDEARGIGKDREPRSFRILRLPINVLCKQLTGEMVDNIVTNRHENGILIGINPYEEWGRVRDSLGKAKPIAADIKKFDGNMLAQVQFLVRDTLVQKFCAPSERKKLLEVVLTSMITNIVAVNDDVFLTTHSMPSGCYLTAIMNSLVHKCYTAMWYKSMVPKATVMSYKQDIIDFVYGDDKLCGVFRKEETLNALTMCAYFEKIGLGLSTADKKIITHPFDEWADINFLKRKFIFHPQLGRMMCPLVDDTIFSMLSWWDTKKEYDVVMQGKLNSFILEAYLRPDYEELRKTVSEALKAKELPYNLWSTEYVHHILDKGLVDSPYNYVY